MQNSDVTAFDIIGDVHGMGTALEQLLARLDYQETDAGFVYKGAGPKRQAIFLGDILDRGPEIRKSLAIVKKMVDNGNAQMVLGNHEFNALAYHTPIDQGFLRPRNERSEKQIKATLEQFDDAPKLWQEYLQWFKTLPLWLEFEHFRVVHACWDHQMIDEYLRRYGTNHITKDMLPESVQTDSFLYQFLDRMLRGTSLKLPDGRSMTAKDGMVRQFFRTKFWAGDPQRYNDVIFQPDPLPEDLQHALLSEDEKEQLLFYGPDEKPLFIGHYWMSGLPEPIVPNIACLDYSAVKYGRLVAYRMDTERHLQKGKFAWVRVEKKER